MFSWYLPDAQFEHDVVLEVDAVALAHVAQSLVAMFTALRPARQILHEACPCKFWCFPLMQYLHVVFLFWSW